MRLAAIVLAAGKGGRFGGDKRKALFRGEPLLHHALGCARAAPVERVITVMREGDTLLPGECVTLASDALAASLKAGIAAAGDVDGVFIFLGDMPLVPHGIAARLLAAIGDGIAAVPVYLGQPGHPVLVLRRGFPLVGALCGDHGLGQLLRGRSDVVRLPVDDEGVVLDADTPQGLAALAARFLPNPII
jgi:molybdenum cofactor cytidylyltransferase